MSWFLTFLEGILSFLSPCTLPLVPIYISYFAAFDATKRIKVWAPFIFVLGFSAVFTLLGAFAGSIGSFFTLYRRQLSVVLGILMILYGIAVFLPIYLPMFKLKKIKLKGIFSCLLLGIVFALAITPCTGAFLGSALMLAANSTSIKEGSLLLFIYSLGLGVPFILTAFLTINLKKMLLFTSKHERIIKILCGVFIIFSGILTALGIPG